jgi:hypothetical protein
MLNWNAAKALSDWIHPDIPGYRFRRIFRPENVIVKLLLPEG